MKSLYIGLVSVVLGACASDLDTRRESVDTGTFGTTMVTLACKRMAHHADRADGDGRVDVSGDRYRAICRDGLAPPADAPDALAALQAARATLVAAVDTALPAAFLPRLQAFLTAEAFQTVYDDGTAIAAVDGLVEMLELAADDAELLAAIERLQHRPGYRPLAPALGAMRAVVRYPGLHDLLSRFLGAITEGGVAEAAWDDLVAALSVTLRHAAPAAEPARPDRTGVLAHGLLFAERELLDATRPVPLVQRDLRGVARVATSGGGVLAPFVDGDGDGLADVDELGRYLDAAGSLLAAPTPFALAGPDPWPHRDDQGRALAATGGPPVYDYVDLDRTLFGALVSDAARLFDPEQGVVLDALRGAAALMGPRRIGWRLYPGGEVATYRGFEISLAPLLDMVHGYLQLLRHDRIDEVLALVRELVIHREAESSRLIEALIQAARLGDLFPDLAMDPGSPLWDELVPVVRQILAVPGLAEDIVRALERPEIATLGRLLGDYMMYKDQFDFDSATQQVVGSLGTPVDRSQPDSNWNRSLLQRLVHLIADSADTVLCNKQNATITIGLDWATYDACELLRVEDVASFYVRSIAYLRDSNGNIVYDGGKPVPAARFDFHWGWIGVVVTDWIIETMVGIEGFRTHPTPQALNRALFLEPPPGSLPDMLDPAFCRDGHRYTTGHGGSIGVWEVTGFYDAVRPLVQPFVDRDQERLFVDLIVVLHRHWPSRRSINHQQTLPGGQNYAYASDIAAWEPLAASILRDSPLMPAMVASMPGLNTVRIGSRSFASIVTDVTRFFLAPRARLARRDGTTSTTTADGKPVPILSPWHVLADAYGRKREAVAADGAGAQAWHAAVSGLVDVLVRGAEQGGAWRFANPRMGGVTVAVIDFLRERLDAHRAAGDLDAWLDRELIGSTEQLVAGPVFAAAADLVTALQASPEARRALEAFASHLTSAVDEESFTITLTAAANLFQLALVDRDIVPIARFLGESLRPERGWIDRHLALFHRASEADADAALTTLLRNLHDEPGPGRTALGDLLDGLSEIHRARPHQDWNEPYTVADYQAFLRGMARFVDDEKYGLRQFIAIIQGRRL